MLKKFFINRGIHAGSIPVKCKRNTVFGPLAQLAEHPTFNRRVQGSIPWGPTITGSICGGSIPFWQDAPSAKGGESRVRISSGWDFSINLRSKIKNVFPYSSIGRAGDC